MSVGREGAECRWAFIGEQGVRRVCLGLTLARARLVPSPPLARQNGRTSRRCPQAAGLAAPAEASQAEACSQRMPPGCHPRSMPPGCHPRRTPHACKRCPVRSLAKQIGLRHARGGRVHAQCRCVQAPFSVPMMCLRSSISSVKTLHGTHYMAHLGLRPSAQGRRPAA